MHVLVIPRGLYCVPRVPLAGIFETHQVDALRAAGVKVGVVSGGVITARYVGRSFPYVARETVSGVPVHRGYRRAILPARWEAPVKAAERTYRVVRPLLEEYMAAHGRPDIVHAHNLLAGGLLARQVAEDFGIPYVVTEHTSTYTADIDALSRDMSVLAQAATSASAVIAVGSQLADSLRACLDAPMSDRVRVVPNVVEPLMLTRPLVARETRPYTITGIGNLISRKNFPLLVRAFARAALPEDARLVIGGVGPELGRLKALAADLDLAHRVDFPGQLTREEVAGLILETDLFAHSSDSESFGVVLIEAMALGVPLLATSSGGPQDIVTREVGLLTQVGNLEEFGDGLSEMYRRRSDFDSDVLREACRTRFGPEAFAYRMLHIYEQAVS